MKGSVAALKQIELEARKAWVPILLLSLTVYPWTGYLIFWNDRSPSSKIRIISPRSQVTRYI